MIGPLVFGTTTSGKINVQPEPPVKTTYHPNVSCCVIKPHALRQSLTGRIIQDIQTKGFNIFGIQSFVLTKKEVEDFYEIYKGKYFWLNRAPDWVPETRISGFGSSVEKWI